MTSRRTAFITGASQGIGAASAVALAHSGFDVAVSSTRVEKLDPVLAEIAAAGARAVPIELDVRSQASIARAMQAAVAGLGAVEVLVNNAAITLRRAALDVTPDEWDAVIRTNITGTFFMTQQMGRHLVAGGREGCVISLASTHGVVGMVNRSTYGITKAAIMHMTRTLAIEWAQHRIRLNAIAPGRVDTPSRAGSYGDPKYIESMLNRVPLRRFGQMDEIAAAVCYFASPAASYITGQTLVMDGGVTAA